MFSPDDRVAVGVSGGADSVALAWRVHEQAARGGCRFAGLIHVHHGLRGAQADADEAFCCALADRLGVPIDVTRVDVAAEAQASRRSIESAARDVRYRAFAEAAARLNASCVATAHTLDDQAETVLLRLLRGAGMRGLSGIRPRLGLIVRPLLSVRRADLRRELEARGEAFRHDESNDDLAIPRNRLRHELLPVIERLAPGGLPAIARLAGQAADLDAFVAAASRRASAHVVSNRDDGRVRLDARALTELPAAVARHLLLELAEGLQPGVKWSSRHLEAIRILARADKPTGHLDLPGLAVERDRDAVDLTPLRTSARDRDRTVAAGFSYALPLPGSVEVPEAGVRIRASRVGAETPAAAPGDPRRALLQADAVQLPLTVRSRRPGDRLRPLGAPGRRKLQDVFVDRKVPRRDRDRVPLVVDATGRILWVAGHTIAEECRVTGALGGVVILELN